MSAKDAHAHPRQPTWAATLGDTLEVVITLAAGAAFVVIGALIIGQVFFRYVLAAPPIWTEELTRYVFVWLAWLSAAVVYRKGQHVTIDAITGFLSERLRFWHDMAVRLVCIAILLFLLKYGWEMTAFTRSRSAALSIPMTYVYASAAVGSAVMLLFALLDAIDSLLRRRLHHAH